MEAWMLRTRQEVMEFFQKEIQRLKQEWHVGELIEQKRIEEIRSLVYREMQALVGTPLSEYTKNDKLLLKDEEIDKDNFWEVIFLVYCAYIPNTLAFGDMSNFKKIAECKGKGYLVSLMEKDNLCEITLEELLGII